MCVVIVQKHLFSHKFWIQAHKMMIFGVLEYVFRVKESDNAIPFFLFLLLNLTLTYLDLTLPWLKLHLTWPWPDLILTQNAFDLIEP